EGGAEQRREGREARGGQPDVEEAGAPGARGAVGGAEGAPMSELDPRIHQVLDGGLPLERLPLELGATVLRLERAAGLLRAAPAPGSVTGPVLAALRRPRGSRGRRRFRRLTGGP